MAAPAIIPLLLRLLPLLVGFGAQAASAKGLGALGASPSFAKKLPRLAGSLARGGLLPQALSFLGFGAGALGAEALLGPGESQTGQDFQPLPSGSGPPARDDADSLNNLLTQIQQPGPGPSLENDESLVRLLQQLQLQGRIPDLLEQSGAVV